MPASRLSDSARTVPVLAVLCLLPAGAPAADGDVTCAAPPDYRSDDAALAALVDRAFPVIGRFASLDAALRSGAPEICLFSGASEALGFFEPDRHRIAIDAGLDPDLQLAILMHEMRHVEQATLGLCPDLSLSMENYARAVWAMEADATAISLIVTWDMAQRGDPGPFRALAGHPHYADIADSFATAMTSTRNVAAGAAAAFSGWYDSETRKRSYYVAGCSAYLDAQDATHALPQYGQLDADFFATLCRLPDGAGFDCSEPPAISD